MVFVLLAYVAYPLVSVGLSRARTRVYYRWIVARMAPQKHACRKHLLMKIRELATVKREKS